MLAGSVQDVCVAVRYSPPHTDVRYRFSLRGALVDQSNGSEKVALVAAAPVAETIDGQCTRIA